MGLVAAPIEHLAQENKNNGEVPCVGLKLSISLLLNTPLWYPKLNDPTHSNTSGCYRYLELGRWDYLKFTLGKNHGYTLSPTALPGFGDDVSHRRT